MKKILTAVFVLMLAAGCASKPKKALVVGLNAEYKPFEYLEGDKFVGFNPDMLSAVMKKAGYEFSFSDMTFDGLLPALQAGKVDLVIGAQATEERRIAVDFSDIYVSDKQVLLVNSEKTFELGNYKGKKIAAQLGTMQEQIARSLEGAEVMTYPTYTAAILDLNNKKIDGIVAGIVASAGYRKENPMLSELGVLSDNTNVGYAFALPKGQDELKAALNKALAELKADGTIEALRKQHLGF